MMAAITMAEKGLDVIIAEKNQLLGRKLRITGKGRCNITNDCEFQGMTSNIISGNKFLLSSLHRFSNHDLIAYLDEGGLETVTERGGRVFPASQKAYDVAEFFVKKLKELKVPVLFGFDAKELIIDEKRVKGVKGILAGKGRTLSGKTVLLCTGGLTYRSTGSDGSGYILAVQAGHGICEPRTSLVALKCREKGDCAACQGLTLKNVKIALNRQNKPIFEDFGEMLFTDTGITGPVVLSLSRSYISEAFSGDAQVLKTVDEVASFLKRPESVLYSEKDGTGFTVSIDLKPALDEETLDKRLIRDLEKYRSKLFRNALCDLLPSSIIPVVIGRSGIDPEKTAGNITRSERKALLGILKNFILTPEGPDDPDHGIVTQGGVDLDGIDPGTLGSKLTKGLYFAGEVMNVDGLTGGYNLTIAFSTGRAAGLGIVRELCGGKV